MWLSFFILFSLMSCQKSQLVTSADVRLSGDNQQAIVNGQNVNSSEDLASHVALISTTNGNGSTEVCTGVFISKNQILTAKHCVVSDINSLAVSFRHSAYDQNLEVTDLPILKIHFFKSEGRNDLALLDVEILPDLQNRPVEMSNSINLHNIDVYVVGYGVSTITEYDSQILRKKLISSLSLNSFQSTFTLMQEHGGICFGDSGGPVLYFDARLRKYILVGISSGIIPGVSENPCLNQSIFMNILFYKNQIQELL